MDNELIQLRIKKHHTETEIKRSELNNKYKDIEYLKIWLPYDVESKEYNLLMKYFDKIFKTTGKVINFKKHEVNTCIYKSDFSIFQFDNMYLELWDKDIRVNKIQYTKKDVI